MLMYEHISWQDDSLTVRMFVKKHDQEGKDCKPKHVFANPVKPSICPVLALAVYILPTDSGARERRCWCFRTQWQRTDLGSG